MEYSSPSTVILNPQQKLDVDQKIVDLRKNSEKTIGIYKLADTGKADVEHGGALNIYKKSHFITEPHGRGRQGSTASSSSGDSKESGSDIGLLENEITKRGSMYRTRVVGGIQGVRVEMKSIVLTFSALATVLALLCISCLLFILRSHLNSVGESDVIVYHEFFPIHNCSIALTNNEACVERKGDRLYSERDWNYIQAASGFRQSIHFHVGLTTMLADIGRLYAETSKDSLKISGIPTFCTSDEYVNAPQLVFKNVSHLHLSEMGNCNNYVKSILTKWDFPNVHSLKLRKMIIEEQVFLEMTRFIDKYNETLHKVEIEECYLCPSPACDAGMINFPDHDFQLVVKKRKDRPEWV